ncbi:MAG TPA: sugar ABC transporter substrate-binding protein [Anaeromyxobacter sp.]|nr:sugar ABC transporter substrate-binding protein [Anaeromyxobacter sp.]
MNRSNRVLLAVGVLALVVAAAPLTARGAGAPKKPATMIGYAAPALYGGQLYIQTSLVDNAQAKGWGVVTTNANADPQKQNNDIDYLISLGVKAIVAVPEDSAGICAAVEKARAAKIPFYTIDRSPQGCKINMTVLSDNRLAGQQAAQVMVDEITKRNGAPKGKVLEITGNLSQNVGQLRRDGFHDVVDKYKDITVIQKVGDWDAAKGQQIAIDVLSANPDLDGIYMHSDNVYGPGTKAAMDQLGRFHKRGEPGHIILTGVDGGPWILEAVLNGVADGAGSQPVSDFGIVVRWIEQELNGKPATEGEVTQAGAPWSPAHVKRNADGTMELFLATTKVTAGNINDPATWTNMDKNYKMPKQ